MYYFIVVLIASVMLLNAIFNRENDSHNHSETFPLQSLRGATGVVMTSNVTRIVSSSTVNGTSIS